MENEKYLSNKLRKAIEQSGLTDDVLAGVYEAIENMDDEDLKEYIYSNGQYFKQNIPAAVQEIPEFRTLVNVEPNWGVDNKEYSKLFGNEDLTEEEFLRNFDKVPYSVVEYVAQQNGMNPKKLLNNIREKQTEQIRADIANSYGENVPGKIAGFVTRTMFPKIVEGAVKEGRDPNLNEVAVDVGSNLAYAVPWTKVIGGAGKAANLLGNSIAPTVSEGLDVAFSDEEKGPAARLSNIGVGTLINAATPYVLKRAGNKVSRILEGKLTPAEEKAVKLLGSTSPRDIVSEQNYKATTELNKLAKAQKKLDKTGDINSLTRDEQNVLYSADNLVDLLYTNPTPEAAAIRDVASQAGNTFNEKLKRSSKQTKKIFENMSEPNKEAFIKDLETNWGSTFDTSPIADANKILGSFATNKAGDLLYADSPESLPFGTGKALVKTGIVEGKKEKERQERIKQRNINKTIRMNKMRSMLNADDLIGGI